MLAAIRTSMTVRLLPLAALLALAAVSGARADEPADPPGRVARVNLTLGTVSMQPAGSESWVSDVLNRPLTNGDKLWADRESRAEMHIGSTAVRLGSETGIEILNIDDRAVQLKLSAGTLQVRVRALGPEQTFEVATPTASVAVLVPGDYRIGVGDGNGPMQIAVAHGQVAVTDQGHEATVGSGQLAEYVGASVEEAQISALPPGDSFDQWVADRDRREDRAVASQYVSREVTGYEDLDDYGSWQTVNEYGPVWVPAVSVGWAPYRYGHWGWIAPWGWTWIDDAPWGFAPFHYGRWVSYGGRWCWAPGPRRYAPVYAPALVGWVGGPHWSVGISIGAGGPPVGWFPLGWNEVYVPSYRVSNNYVRNVNVTNIHVTNTTINNYITNNTTIVDGRKTIGDGGLRGQRYANLAVAGAVTATSRTAFTSAQPVAAHLTTLPREDLAKAPIGTGAPAIPPTANSLGRPAAATPSAAPGLWSRPVVARTPPPPPPPSFEAQRHAVVANGGLPVPTGRLTAPQVARPGAAPPAAASRADVIHVGPPAAVRPGTPDAHPAPVVPAKQGPRRETGAPARAERATTEPRPAPPTAPAPDHGVTATAPPAPRPVPEYRPPAQPHEAVPQPVPHPAPVYRPPVQPHEASPQPAPRQAPEYRPPAQPQQAAPQATPQPTPHPAPAYRPPVQPHEASPQPAPRQAPEYRPPAQPQQAAPQATPQPTPHPAPAYRPPTQPRETAPQPTPHPAPEYRAPAPSREAAPQPAPHPVQEYRPPAPRESAPAPREVHAPPPAPPPAHPSPPPADKAAKPDSHDKR